MGGIRVPSISNIVRNPGSTIAGGLIGGLPGAAVGAIMGNKQDQTPQLSEDPRLTALRGQMGSEAKKFRADMPKLLADERAGIKAAGDTATAQGIKTTRQNYNRRGLLYSGLRQGGEQTVRSNVASGVARQTAGVNKQYKDLANAKDNAAANVGLAGYGEALQRANMLNDSRMQNQIERQQSMQQLGQGLGYLGGMAASNYGSGPQTSGSMGPSNAYYNPNANAVNRI